MTAEIRRFPCGCRIASNRESCSHVDAAAARAIGVWLQARNAELIEAAAARAEAEAAKGEP